MGQNNGPSEVSGRQPGDLRQATPSDLVTSATVDTVARYKVAKQRSSSMAKWLAGQEDPGARTEGRRLAACWSWMLVEDHVSIDVRRIIGSNSCDRHLLCPACAMRRARRVVQAYTKRLAQVLVEDRAEPLRPYLVTLTVKSGDDLRERMSHLRALVRILGQRRRDCRKGRQWTEWSRIEGAVMSYEVTRTAAGWHPHVHCLALLSTEPDNGGIDNRWPALSGEVLDITGDSFIVDARPILATDLEGIQEALIEVCKYALKFASLSCEDTWTAYRALQRSRLLESWGILRGVEVPEDDQDDQDDEEGDAIVYRTLWEWLGKARTYNLRRVGIVTAESLAEERRSWLELGRTRADQRSRSSRPVKRPPRAS